MTNNRFVISARRKRVSFRISVRLAQHFGADLRPVREIIKNYAPLDITDISKYRRGQTFGPKRKALIETLAAVEFGITSGAVIEVR